MTTQNVCDIKICSYNFPGSVLFVWVFFFYEEMLIFVREKYQNCPRQQVVKNGNSVLLSSLGEGFLVYFGPSHYKLMGLKLKVFFFGLAFLFGCIIWQKKNECSKMYGPVAGNKTSLQCE